ncbi:unnamed protein product, partial [Mesorhabditis spiculigera]
MAQNPDHTSVNLPGQPTLPDEIQEPLPSSGLPEMLTIVEPRDGDPALPTFTPTFDTQALPTITPELAALWNTLLHLTPPKNANDPRDVIECLQYVLLYEGLEKNGKMQHLPTPAHTCNICGERFVDAGLFLGHNGNHLLLLEYAPRKYPCGVPFCTLRFSTVLELQNHWIEVHPTSPNGEQLRFHRYLDVGIDPRRPFQCKIPGCDMAFATAKEVERHEQGSRTHPKRLRKQRSATEQNASSPAKN